MTKQIETREFETNSDGTTTFDVNGRKVNLRLCNGFYEPIPLRVATAEETATLLHAKYFGYFTREFKNHISRISGRTSFPSERKVALGIDTIQNSEGIYLIDTDQHKLVDILDRAWPNPCDKELYHLMNQELSKGFTQEGIRFSLDRSLRFIPRAIKEEAMRANRNGIENSAFYLALFGEEGRRKLSELVLLGDHSINTRDITGSGLIQTTRETFNTAGHFILESYPVSDEEVSTSGGLNRALYIDNYNTRGITRRTLASAPLTSAIRENPVYAGVFKQNQQLKGGEEK